MNRLETLFSNYSYIPRTIVIKADSLTEGIRFTDALRDAGKWAFPDSEQSFEWDVDVDKSAQDVKDGVLQLPEQFSFTNHTVVRLISDKDSPYHIEHAISGSGFALCYNGGELEPIFFDETPAWYYKKTSSGALMGKVCMARAPCVASTALLQYCEYFRVGKPCLYCNFNPYVEQQKEMGGILFYVWYGIEYLVRLIQLRSHWWAYKSISFEKESNAFERAVGYMNVRDRYYWIKFL